MLGHQGPRLRQRLANCRHGERSACPDAKRGTRECFDPLGMQVATIKLVEEAPNI